MLEKVILVDENDYPIGSEEKLRAHQCGLLHRAFSIFVLRKGPEIEVLMQKRSIHKYHGGGLWTNTCCGHPRPGESIFEAANRRLNEEMGLTVALQEIGIFTYKANVGNNLTEHEIDHVFIGYWGGQSFIHNPEEVEIVEWRKIKEVFIEMNLTPSIFTIWLKEALAMMIEYTKDSTYDYDVC